MAITGQQIVTDALAAVGAYGIADNLDPNDAALVLRRLNRLLDSWANEGLMMFQTPIETFTTVPGTAAYSTTLLSGASAGRPADILDMYLRLSNIDYSIELIDYQKFGAIPFKGVLSVPTWCFADPGTTDWTLNFFPIPNAVYTGYVTVVRPLSGTPITLSTVVTLPVGYERAIVDNLAVDIASSFGVQASPVLVASAREARAVLKRAKYIPLEMDTGLGADAGDVSNGFIYQGWR